MSYERLGTRPSPTSKEAFSPDEQAYISAETQFVSRYMEPIASSLALGSMKYLILRDSNVLAGFSSDSRALIRERGESLQKAVQDLS